jgi:hypothetical protein
MNNRLSTRIVAIALAVFVNATLLAGVDRLATTQHAATQFAKAGVGAAALKG